MNHQFTIQFTEQHIKYAEWRFFLRHFNDHIFIWLFVFVILVVKGCFMQKVDWVAGALTGVLFLWACFMLGFFRNGRSERLARLKERGGQVEYEFSDELFKLRTNSERAELKWETFRALWIFSKAWLLLSKGGGYLTFPVDQTPAEARDFLKQKVAAVGAEVK